MYLINSESIRKFNWFIFPRAKVDYPILYLLLFLCLISVFLFMKIFLSLGKEEVLKNDKLRSKLLTKLIITGLASEMFFALVVTLGIMGGALK